MHSLFPASSRPIMGMSNIKEKKNYTTLYNRLTSLTPVHPLLAPSQKRYDAPPRSISLTRPLRLPLSRYSARLSIFCFSVKVSLIYPLNVQSSLRHCILEKGSHDIATSMISSDDVRSTVARTAFTVFSFLGGCNFG